MDTAKFGSMPRSAIDSGLADHVLPRTDAGNPTRMPQTITTSVAPFLRSPDEVRTTSASDIRRAEIMLFSSLTDPVDIARAEAAFEEAWAELKSTISGAVDERERTRLACIAAALVAIAEDEGDLKRRAIARYRREGEPSFSSSAKRT